MNMPLTAQVLDFYTAGSCPWIATRRMCGPFLQIDMEIPDNSGETLTFTLTETKLAETFFKILHERRFYGGSYVEAGGWPVIDDAEDFDKLVQTATYGEVIFG